MHRLRQIAGSMLKGFKAPFAFLTTVKVDSCAGVKIGIRLIAEYPVLDPAYQPENSDTGLAPLLLTSPLPLPDGSEVFSAAKNRSRISRHLLVNLWRLWQRHPVGRVSGPGYWV